MYTEGPNSAVLLRNEKSEHIINIINFLDFGHWRLVRMLANENNPIS